MNNINSTYNIKCSICGQSYSNSDFILSVIKSGIILLEGILYGYVGHHCKYCNNVSLIKYSIDTFHNIIYGLPDAFKYISICNPVNNNEGAINYNNNWRDMINKKFRISFNSERFTSLSNLYNYDISPYIIKYYTQFDLLFFDYFSNDDTLYKKIFGSETIGRFPFFYGDLDRDKEIPDYIFDQIYNRNFGSFWEYNRKKDSKKDWIRSIGDIYSLFCSNISLQNQYDKDDCLYFLYKENTIRKLIEIENKYKKIMLPRYYYMSNFRKKCFEFMCNFQEYNSSIKIKNKLLSKVIIEYFDLIEDTYPLQIYDSKEWNCEWCVSNGRFNEEISLDDVTPIDVSSIKLRKFVKVKRDKNEIEMLEKIWSVLDNGKFYEVIYKHIISFVQEYYKYESNIFNQDKDILILRDKSIDNIYNDICNFNNSNSNLDKNTVNEFKKTIYDNDWPNIITTDLMLINELNKILYYTKFKKNNINILIIGESGTGKELVAKAIHKTSGREKYHSLNATNLSKELFESEVYGHAKGSFTGAADKKIGILERYDQGTVLLDEIGDLDINLQPKLLRYLEYREFNQVGNNETIKSNILILLSTNADLNAKVKNNSFRNDLFQRINKFVIRLPPLRDRVGDIGILSEYFLNKIKKEMGINNKINVDQDVIKIMKKYDWPGNIRELENVIHNGIFNMNQKNRRTITIEDIIDKIPIKYDKTKKIKSNLTGNQKFITEDMIKALLVSKGNKTAAAKILGVKPNAIYDRIKKMKLRGEIVPPICYESSQKKS